MEAPRISKGPRMKQQARRVLTRTHGLMLRLSWNRLVGSYYRFTSTNRP